MKTARLIDINQAEYSASYSDKNHSAINQFKLILSLTLIKILVLFELLFLLSTALSLDDFKLSGGLCTF